MKVSWSSTAVTILLLPASFAIGWLLTGLAVAIALRRARRSADLPWTERARRTWPARGAAGSTAIVACVGLAMFVFARGVPLLGLPWRSAPWAVLAGLSALFGGLDVGQRLERRICRSKEH